MKSTAIICLIALTMAFPDPTCSTVSTSCNLLKNALWYIHAADGFMARTTDMMSIMNFSACTNITTIDPMYIVYRYMTFSYGGISGNLLGTINLYLMLIRDTLQAVDNWLMYCGYSIKNVLMAIMNIVNYISQNPVGYDMKVANNTAKNGVDAYHFLGIAYSTMTISNGWLTGGYLGEAFFDIFISTVPH